ncbi:MAG: hypothetical protein LUF90_09565 [Rikenellaceae bacterium]|nr:hypothetical protein [Rikenellaceae bacterium]
MKRRKNSPKNACVWYPGRWGIGQMLYQFVEVRIVDYNPYSTQFTGKQPEGTLCHK